MNKKSIITMMLALVTMTGLAQTKTATVTGYSPALKDGTLVLAAPALKDGTLVLAAVGNIGNCCRHRTSRAFCLHTTC